MLHHDREAASSYSQSILKRIPLFFHILEKSMALNGNEQITQTMCILPKII